MVQEWRVAPEHPGNSRNRENRMNIKAVCTIAYSPTRTSYRIGRAIAAGVAAMEENDIDLTYLKEGLSRSCSANELAIIVAPVYGGRVASKAIERLSAVRGSQTPAIVAVVYGNREFEDALLELTDVANQAGFLVAGAGAFVGEHSFSTAEMPVAVDRPDEMDLAVATEFGAKVRDIVSRFDDPGQLKLPQIPGNRPYKEGVSSLPFGPRIDEGHCTLCGICVPLCPVGALNIGEKLALDVSRCTLCCACSKNCPEAALSISETPAQAKRQWLHEHCRTRKEPQLFYCS